MRVFVRKSLWPRILAGMLLSGIAGGYEFAMAAGAGEVVSVQGDVFGYRSDSDEMLPVNQGDRLPDQSILCLESDGQIIIDATGRGNVFVRLKGEKVWTVDAAYFDPDVELKFSNQVQREGNRLFIDPVLSGTPMRKAKTQVREGVVNITLFLKDDRGHQHSLYSVEVKQGQQAQISACGVVRLENFDIARSKEDVPDASEEPDTDVVVEDIVKEEDIPTTDL